MERGPVFGLAAMLLLAATGTLASSSSPPSITQHPLNATVVRNEPVTLDCRASNAATIEWFREGEPVRTAPDDPTSHRILLPDGSLFFLKAVQTKKDTDAGVYWCVASNKDGVARSNNATLDIAYMRDDFRSVPRDTDAVLDSDVVLECHPPKGNPAPLVKWRKDGDSLDLSSAKRVRIDASGSLVITGAQKSDEGRYQCAAENMAAVKISNPVRLRINEPPSFLTTPTSKSVRAGDDVLLECAATGDPHPNIVWTRDSASSDQDIDLSRATVVHGKGLRIEAARPSDEGTYACAASNAAGSTVAKAHLRVLEPPVITVKPEATVQADANGDASEIILVCVSAGSPAPVVFWTKEGDGRVLSSGSDVNDRVRVSLDGSLRIARPRLSDSGHYTCSCANEVGSALARSHVIVYDARDISGSVYHGAEDEDLAEARLVTSEAAVYVTEATPIGSSAVKVAWKAAGSRFVQGYRIMYRPASSSSPTSWQSVDVAHPGANSFVLNRLEPSTAYDVLVQPFFRSVSGSPSQVLRVSTTASVPMAAPAVVSAERANATAVRVRWTSGAGNARVHSYELVIRGNGTWVNTTVDAPPTANDVINPSAVNEVVLLIDGMADDKRYTVEVAAVNGVGRGPFSFPVDIAADARSLVALTPDPHVDHDDDDHLKRLTWVIAVVSAVTFVLLLASVVFLYRRRASPSLILRKDSGGYLEAAHVMSANAYMQQQRSALLGGHNLWIDRRWNTADYEKDSNASEKKLLAASASATAVKANSSSNSDTEYTYVDNRKAGQQHHNGSSFATASTSSSSSSGHDMLQPYASTEIFRPRYHHYAAPIFKGGVANKPVNNEYAAALSLDDLLRQNRTRQSTSSSASSRRRKNRPAASGPNLLDLLPPPPSHPPPPPAREEFQSKSRQMQPGDEEFSSQESLAISAKGLFQHPAYRQVAAMHKELPGSDNELDASHTYSSASVSSHDRPSRKENHYAAPSAHNSNGRNNSDLEDHSLVRRDLERDLHHELIVFNEAISRFAAAGFEADHEDDTDEDENDQRVN